jgi:hypothetical protein
MRLRMLRTVGVVAATAAVVGMGPAIAHTAVVAFARNAGHVDGFRAVGPLVSANSRAGKLVATNSRGYLPDNILVEARNSSRLGGASASSYQRRCAAGAIGGYAQVPGDLGSEWTKVRGYLLATPQCIPAEVTARQESPGVYRLQLMVCSSNICPRRTFPAVVSVASADNTVATVWTTAETPGGPGHPQYAVEEVDVRTPDGTPTSTTFSVVFPEPLCGRAPVHCNGTAL